MPQDKETFFPRPQYMCGPKLETLLSPRKQDDTTAKMYTALLAHKQELGDKTEEDDAPGAKRARLATTEPRSDVAGLGGTAGTTRKPRAA